MFYKFLLLLLLLGLVFNSVQTKELKFQIKENEYTISMERINNNLGLPLLDSFRLQQNNPSDESPWLYNYNVAYCPFVPPEIVKLYSPSDQIIGVAVRVQNLTNDPSNIYSVGPSSIVYAYGVCEGGNLDQCRFNTSHMADPDYLITGPDSASFQYVGAEDPRIVLVGSTIYMYYTAVNMNGTNARAQLALATCDTTSVLTIQDFKNCWVLHGPIIENSVFWSKSAGLLYRPEKETQYLFYGDTNIFIATTTDLINYSTLMNQSTSERTTLFTTRDNTFFDSVLVESGPEPLQLSDGNWLYLYNSGQQVQTPNQKPNWNIQYNLGFVILNGTSEDFSSESILYRSPTPLFSPELDWELCDDTSLFWSTHGLTPLVIFVEGWVPLGNDQFLVLYQGCDSVMGTALITIKIQ
ncbi:hypothetical protein DICPUDRAFT_33930 [Dictyostelium purpureum]|uniref:Uncharacterized protein n=1 Tax=Dictyostelium purpureum TaxID=5786 RepID=F0ZLR0_DICPU|nr:uncharacterized protein DICPUDRAFT_33930 [Dictyostelium purpureum]EGC35102.1 hypothetical protein DICPUDRAFT_33930 [Dictyostelium purpureum]|eukprot:XP_003288354.1 hypothetical protein DICPUDRAFT_33930 [Dictyostelium purpureum]